MWLTYWCVFGSLTVVDDFLGCMLESIPFYFYVKVGFFIWMMLPTTNGAKVVYTGLVKPQMVKYQPYLQKVIDDIAGSTDQLKDEAMKQMNDPKNISAAANLMNKVNEMQKE